MQFYPNAKINLGLYITGVLPNGYHTIETVFYPIPLTDKITFTEATELSLEQAGKVVEGTPEDNLVIKAYRLLQADFSLPALRIELDKNIPFGAGLGGGSADASFTLCALNEQYNLGLSQDQLAAYAAKLGADCPFFIYNTPMMATGIGTDFTPISLSLKGLYLALIKPKVFVSTADAYRQTIPAAAPINLSHLAEIPLEEWKDKVSNQFEESVFAQHPKIQEVKENLYAAGAIYASMSGSGSSVFGLFHERPKIPVKPYYESVWVGELE